MNWDRPETVGAQSSRSAVSATAVTNSIKRDGT